MRGKNIDRKKAKQLEQLLNADGAKLPPTLSGPLREQAGKEGESIFTTALRSATPDQVARAERITGPINIAYCVENYKRTQNPLWLWLGVSAVEKPEDIPNETFLYFKQTSVRLFKEILDQVQSLERVKITANTEVQEGITHRAQEMPSLPDVMAALGLSQPGRNLFQAIARDLQAVSVAVGIEDLIRQTGCSQEKACSAMALVLGRSSPEAGPSTEMVRKLMIRGRKLLRDRPTSTSK